MKVNVTNEEFAVLCKTYSYTLENDIIFDRIGEKGYIQECGEIISYLSFLEDLEREMNDDDIYKSMNKVSPRSLKEKPAIYAPSTKNLTSEECDQLINQLKTKVINIIHSYHRLKEKESV